MQHVLLVVLSCGSSLLLARRPRNIQRMECPSSKDHTIAFMVSSNLLRDTLLILVPSGSVAVENGKNPFHVCKGKYGSGP